MLEVPVPPWFVWQWHGVIALLLLVPSWLLYFGSLDGEVVFD